MGFCASHHSFSETGKSYLPPARLGRHGPQPVSAGGTIFLFLLCFLDFLFGFSSVFTDYFWIFFATIGSLVLMMVF
jgi:hypothetical protein